jgi:hypothetical protein
MTKILFITIMVGFEVVNIILLRASVSKIMKNKLYLLTLPLFLIPIIGFLAYSLILNIPSIKEEPDQAKESANLS